MSYSKDQEPHQGEVLGATGEYRKHPLTYLSLPFAYEVRFRQCFVIRGSLSSPPIISTEFQESLVLLVLTWQEVPKLLLFS